MKTKLDTLNHAQRARFARALYGNIRLTPNEATRLFLESVKSTARK